MKRMIIAATVASVMSAAAFEADVTPSVDLSVGSAFVGNGITWVDGPVFTPSATLGIDSKDGKHHTSFTYWNCINLDDTKGYDNPDDEKGHITEWDVFADYTYTGIDWVSLSAGAIYYVFPKIDDYTTDVYVGATLNVLLNPSMTILYDVDGANSGFHGDFGISHSFDITEEFSIGAWAKMVWADSDYGAAYFSDDGKSNAGIASYGTGLTASYALNDNLSLGAGLSYWKLHNDDGVLGATHDQWESVGIESPEDNVVGSLSVSYTF